MATTANTAPSSAIITRLRKKRDLETTMNTLKKLLEPSVTLSTKKGSRKKNKPRSLAKVLPKQPSNKSISRTETCSEDDGEYYPNKLKRIHQSKKTILKPRHKLKVVVTTNKRKRCTPHKGIEPLYKESPTCNQDHKLTDLNTNTSNNVDIQSESNIKVSGNVDHTMLRNKEKDSALDSANVHTDLEVHTPPPSHDSIRYDLISPPHKSLTQLTTDDLIRMDEDSLCDEDLMEILTCPSPVWWEDPEECRGPLFITKTFKDSINNNENGDKHTFKDGNGVSLKRTLSVTKCKAKKIAKLENILGHIKSLVKGNDTLVIPEIDKNIDKCNNANAVSAVCDDAKEVTPENNDKIKVNENSHDGPEVSKYRTISSSGSEISVNEDDLLRNLECINIPIQNIDILGSDLNIIDNKTTDVVKLHMENEITPIEKELNRQKCKIADEGKLSGGKSIVVMETSKKELCKTGNVSNKQKKLNKNNSKHGNQFNETTKTKSVPDSNEELKEEISCELKHKSILKKLKQSDDILDVRLIKTPTNISNEVKIWSKLDNFKRHNFKPQDFANEVIDVEDELQFSMIDFKGIPEKELDPLEIVNETILIDDDSNDGIATKSVNIINLDVIDKLNDVTITAITGNCESQSRDNTELNVTKNIVTEANVSDQDIISEDTIRIGNALNVRLIETSDTHPDTTIKAKHKLKSTANEKEPRKYTNNFKKNKNLGNPDNKLQGLRILPIKTTDIPQSQNSHQKYIEQTNEDTTNKNNSILNIINASSSDILRSNDVDVSLVTSSSPKKDKNVKIDDNPIKKNDLSITFVSNNDIKGIAIAPMILPTLTKNPTKPTFESPKSIKSSNSESTVELSEGTISDTNIHFLDEYEENREDLKKDELEIHDNVDNTNINLYLGEETDITVESDPNAEYNSVVGIFSENIIFQDIKSIGEEEYSEIAQNDISVEINNQASEDVQNNEQISDNVDKDNIDDEIEQNEINHEKKSDELDQDDDNTSVDLQNLDEDENTNKDEFVTVYKILSSNSDTKINTDE